MTPSVCRTTTRHLLPRLLLLAAACLCALVPASASSCTSTFTLVDGDVINVAVMVWLPGLPMGLFTGDLASTNASTGGYTTLAQPAQLALDMWVKMMDDRDGNITLSNNVVIKINPVYINLAADVGGWDVEYGTTGVPLFMIAGTYPDYPGSACDPGDGTLGTYTPGLFYQMTSLNTTFLNETFGITQAFTFLIPPYLMLDPPTDYLMNLIEDDTTHIVVHPFASSQETFICEADTVDCVTRGRLDGARRFETLFATFYDSTYNTNAAMENFHTLGVSSVVIIQDAWDTSATFTKWAGAEAIVLAESLNLDVAYNYTFTTTGCTDSTDLLATCPPTSTGQQQIFPNGLSALDVAKLLKAADIDALVIVAATQSSGAWTLAELFIQMQAIDYTPKAISWAGGIQSGSLLDYLPTEDLLYTWTTKPWDYRLKGSDYYNPSSSTNFELLPATSTKYGPEIFSDEFESLYGPDRIGGGGYAHPMYSSTWTELCSPAVMWGTLMIMQKLVEISATLDVPSILAKAPSVSSPGGWHLVQFDRYGRTFLVNEVLEEMTSGTPVVLSPYNIGTAADYPIPTWKERVFDPQWYSESGEKVLLAVNSLAIVLCLVLTGLVLYYWRTPVIRAATPSFCIVIILGGIMMLSSNYFATLVVSDAHCAASTWLLTIGFTLVFASLFIKTFRIWRIFGQQRLQVLKMKDSDLLLAVAGFVLVDLIINAIWQGLLGMNADVMMPDALRPASNYYVCNFGDARSLIFLHIALKASLLLFGVGLTWAVRGVPSQFNESASIAFSLYNVSFVVAFIIPIISADLGGRHTVYLIRGFAIIFVVLATLGLLYIPKIVVLNSKTRILPMGAQTVDNHTMLSEKGASSGKSGKPGTRSAGVAMAIDIPGRTPVSGNRGVNTPMSNGGDRSPKRLPSVPGDKYMMPRSIQETVPPSGQTDQQTSSLFAPPISRGATLVRPMHINHGIEVPDHSSSPSEGNREEGGI